MDKTSNASSTLALYDDDDDEYYVEKEDRCDESRCVSLGRSNLHKRSFTCYGDDGTHFPRMCADGFLPVVVEDEPPRMSARFRYGFILAGAGYEEIWESPEDVPVQYFTCCPPRHAAAIAAGEDAVITRRRCDDPVGGLDAGITGACGVPRNSTDSGASGAVSARMHLRSMKPNPTMITSYHYPFFEVSSQDHSVLCCDEPLETDDDDHDGSNRTTYIEDTQCVPYRNDYYRASRLDLNHFGDLSFMSCDFSNGDFPVVSPPLLSREGDDVPTEAAASRLYRCCRNGPAIRSIWVRDSAFRITFGLPLFFQIAAVLVSFVVFLALLIPLLKQLIHGTPRTTSSRTGNQTRTRHRTDRAVPGEEKPYSPYNLYLLYLSLWDLVGNAVYGVSYGMILTGKHRYYTTPVPIYYACVIANLWINAFIVHQLLVLLQRSMEAQRIVPVSLTRASLEFALASTIALVSGFSPIFLNVNYGWFAYGLTWFPPITYVGYAAVLIWKRGYLRSTSRLLLGSSNHASNQALRELTIYFLRIVGVFFVIWIPTLSMSFASGIDRPWVFIIAGCLGAIQPVVTFFFILQKSDVRKYILDLVTCSCELGRSTEEPRERRGPNTNFAGPSPRP
mmetsp:Transcript_13241/g.31140  ORF Transcript_13241/g.31140 Transcript_13241/m.31140 type:complete len:619 (+) Transcript_13241:86-1942(+)